MKKKLFSVVALGVGAVALVGGVIAIVKKCRKNEEDFFEEDLFEEDCNCHCGGKCHCKDCEEEKGEKIDIQDVEEAAVEKTVEEEKEIVKEDTKTNNETTDTETEK